MRLISLILGLLLLITGCSEQPKEQQILDLITNLKKAQYELQKDAITNDALSKIHENIKPYLTEKAYNDMLTNREAGLTVEAAKKDYNVTVGKIKIDEIKHENNSVSVTYIFELNFSSSNKIAVKTVTGQSTIIQVGDSLKIDRNWDSLTAKEIESLE